MRVQLWSCNYAPEPTGIAPVSRTLAVGLRDAGHEVSVVAAHSHYPSPEWGARWMPYREERDGIPVLRLPLLIGRATASERLRQELSYLTALTASTPFLGRPDVFISASPSFPALLPAMMNRRIRRVPWILWLHDILPDGAETTGLLEPGLVLELSRRLERAAYRAADEIVVLSRAFVENLVGKSVDRGKIELIYDPATREAPTPGPEGRVNGTGNVLRLLSMGNIGHSQGLAPLVREFERSDVRADLVITGNGVALDEVKAEIATERVTPLGLVDDDRLERELTTADVALVTQHYEGGEFNIPSKLMNFMAYGLPVLAAVNPSGEVARIVRESGGGWVVDSSTPGALPRAIAEIAAGPAERIRRGQTAREFAAREFSKNAFVSSFGRVLERVTSQTRV